MDIKRYLYTFCLLMIAALSPLTVASEDKFEVIQLAGLDSADPCAEDGACNIGVCTADPDCEGIWPLEENDEPTASSEEPDNTPAFPVAHVVEVDSSGSFSPQNLVIYDGDTVHWQFTERTDSIIPISPNFAGIPGLPEPSACRRYRQFKQDDVNEFTGPMKRGAAGIFLLGANDLSKKNHYSLECETWGDVFDQDTQSCQIRNQDTSDKFAGVFIRPSWDDIHLGPGKFAWELVDAAIEDAVTRGKFFSIGVKTGSHTPSWIFEPAIAGNNNVNPIQLRDGSTKIKEGSCGTRMTVGSPADPNYWHHYREMLTALAERIKAKNAWYRALAYIKPSGMNVHTHENRLPKRCWFPIGTAKRSTNEFEQCGCNRNAKNPRRQCQCNPQIWAVDGSYTPDALYDFYSKQFNHIAQIFPDKQMSYALIQAGYPLVNNKSEYEFQDIVMLDGSYLSHSDPDKLPQSPLPKGTEQTEGVIDRGISEQGMRFTVQHNALDNTGKINRWVSDAADNGQITGFQTVNNIASVADMRGSFERALSVNSVFVEIYENAFNELKDNGPLGFSFSRFNRKFQTLRRSTSQPEEWLEIGDPSPLIFQHTFEYVESATGSNQISRSNYRQYVHGWKCDTDAPHIGSITIKPRT